MSAEKKMTIGRTLIAMLKPSVSTSASGPNTMSMPAREKPMTASTPSLSQSSARRPASRYSTMTASTICSANAAAVTLRFMARRLVESSTATASMTRIPAIPISFSMCPLC